MVQERNFQHADLFKKLGCFFTNKNFNFIELEFKKKLFF